MKIKINGKNTAIKRYDQLTLSEYKKLILQTNDSGMIDLILYLSIITGVEYEKAQNFEVKGLHLINTMIGEPFFILGNQQRLEKIRYIEDEKPSLIFNIDNQILNLKKYKTNKVAHRILIENEINKERTYFDLYVFTLAMVLSKSFDYDEIIEMQEKLQDKNALHVLSLGCFFFFNILNIETFVSKIIKRWLKKLLMRISSLNNKQE